MSRLAQQEIWRKRLSAAEAAYQACTEELRLALVRRHAEASPEAEEQVRRAEAHKAEARREYLRILRIFTDLVLRGKSPGANE